MAKTARETLLLAIEAIEKYNSEIWDKCSIVTIKVDSIDLQYHDKLPRSIPFNTFGKPDTHDCCKTPCAPSPTDCCNAGPSKEQYKDALTRLLHIINADVAPSRSYIEHAIAAAKALLEGGQQ